MSDHRPKAAILAVGTEITTGQIINSNASTLASRLSDLGFVVENHASVPDDRPLIHAALQHLKSIGSELIVVTGGLGPTSDDFTREVIADWFKDSLRFDENSWQRVVRRLDGFGIAVAESNRRQCYFPLTSAILENNAGTASGFWMQTEGYPKLACLPGPPSEINAIWHDHLAALLQTSFVLPPAEKLLRWQCIGKSESALGEIVEAVIQGSSLKSGYRPHVPYVEIKIWCPCDAVTAAAPVLNALDQALKPWTVAKDDEDLAEMFWQSAGRFRKVSIHDSASGGHFGRRLLESRAKRSEAQPIEFELNMSPNFLELADPNENGHLSVQIKPIAGKNSWVLETACRGHRSKTDIAVEYKFKPEHRDRYHRMLVELTLHRMVEQLKSQT